MSVRRIVSLLSKARVDNGAALRSISLLWVGTLGGAGLAFATQVLLARVLGVEQFGSFSAALAMVMLLAPLAGFGVAGYWLNAFGREGWQGRRWVPGSIRFLSVSTVAVLSLLLMWAWLGPHDHVTTWLLSILAAHVLGQAALELASAKFQLEGRHARLAGWQFTPHLMRFMGVLALVVFIGREDFAAEHVAWLYASVAFLILLLGGYQIALMAWGQMALEGHGPKAADASSQSMDQPHPGAVASAAWPFGLAGVFYLIYFQSDIILIKYLVDESAAGLYNVAFVVMSAIYMFPSVVYQKFLLPRLHRWAHHDVVKLQKTYRVGNLLTLLTGVAAMIMLWLLAPFVLPLVFGYEYQGAVSLLLILAFAAPFRFLASSAGAMLVTRNHMRIKVRLMGAAAVFNVVLNFILIPIHGTAGAAVATVASDVLLCALYVYYSNHLIATKICTRDIHE